MSYTVEQTSCPPNAVKCAEGSIDPKVQAIAGFAATSRVCGWNELVSAEGGVDTDAFTCANDCLLAGLVLPKAQAAPLEA